MLSNKREGVVDGPYKRGDDFFTARRVAQAHGEIAQPPLVADPPDGAAFHATRELFFGPREQGDKVRVIQAVSHRKIALATDLRELVPRTNELAIVATVDTVADQRAQRLRNAALQLDGEIRDAAPRVELVRPDDRPGRTDVDPGVAADAVLALAHAHRAGPDGMSFRQGE